ncbi:hypothetical protein BHE74_00030927 [Ensete ventricosum]|nr:hypothetical protein BHE74_00030927 [Ensete ventricosum]
MRLNRIELFYVLVAAIGSESRHCLRERDGHMHVVCMQRWLATARPPTGAVGHGLATCKGRPAVARPPARAAARRGSSPQGRPPAGTANPQGVAARDQPYYQQRRWCQSQGWLPLGMAAVGRKGQLPPAQGQQRR